MKRDHETPPRGLSRLVGTLLSPVQIPHINQLIVWRDSVCAGDDGDAPHEVILPVGGDSLRDVTDRLLAMRYLASISGGPGDMDSAIGPARGSSARRPRTAVAPAALSRRARDRCSRIRSTRREAAFASEVLVSGGPRSSVRLRRARRDATKPVCFLATSTKHLTGRLGYRAAARC